MDMWSKARRSEMMAKIKSKGNKTTELRFLRLLRMNGVTGWRRHANLPGSPDFFFPVQKVAVFLDGCFWHGCAKCYREPTTNVSFWKQKVVGNRRRDRRNSKALRAIGIRVVRIWEHSLKSTKSSRLRLGGLIRMLGTIRPSNGTKAVSSTA
ncbi:MAG: DNA mismatch endonuclease Vsr [Sphingomonadales bacterium]|nr:DNA mismatch endonuclease Vsr [Sphingomonadales bacterium]